MSDRTDLPEGAVLKQMLAGGRSGADIARQYQTTRQAVSKRVKDHERRLERAKQAIVEDRLDAAQDPQVSS